MAWMVYGPADASAVLFSFEPELEFDLDIAISFGKRPLTPEELASFPRTLRIDRPRLKKVPEFIGSFSGPFYVNQQVRDTLEALEPGVHTFLPLRLKTERPFNGATDHGDYFIICSPPVVDAVVIEQTLFYDGIGRAAFEASLAVSAAARPSGIGYVSLTGAGRERSHITVRRSAIAGRHLWKLPRVFASAYMASDTLRDIIVANKMRGLAFEPKCIEID